MVASALYADVLTLFGCPQVREADPLAGASRLSQGVLLRQRQDDLHHEGEVERKGEVARAEGLEPPTLSSAYHFGFRRRPSGRSWSGLCLRHVAEAM